MCGIYGYIGQKDAFDVVLEGLGLLQYRGYDSCGIAYFDNGFKVTKAVGTLDNLKHPAVNSRLAFGHTRWATNGQVNVTNAHPHYSVNHEYTLVHNGIINNAEQLKSELEAKGIKFYSQTDTEVIANLVYTLPGDIEEKLKACVKLLDGSYSLIIGDKDKNLYLLKKFSPLNFVKAADGIYISSDKSSLPSGELYTLKDGDIIKINENTIEFIQGRLEFVKHENDIKQLSKGKYPHYMIKEIMETPRALKNTYNSICQTDFAKVFEQYKKITFIGCGTAYHSCLVGEYLFKQLSRFDTEHFLASNYLTNKKISKKHLHIIVSQSGETADCIKVAEQIKKQKGKILLITNEEKSSLANLVDIVICTHANKEIAVASTKTYCCQLFVFEYIYHKLKDKNYNLNIDEFATKIEKYINKTDVSDLVDIYKTENKMIMIGKNFDYLVLKEASLKIREIDYFYTIPMYAGELKHGTLSLVDENTDVIALDTQNSQEIQTAISEIKSRKGRVINMQKYLPKDIFQLDYKAIYAIIPFQLLSYNLALKLGINPDMPKNLAKSVTVE